jgi:hypothetical protein
MIEKKTKELVNRGKGQRFDPGHGRIMKEWFVTGKGSPNWVALAKEAYDFVDAVTAVGRSMS